MEAIMFFISFLAVLNRGPLAIDQVHMKGYEHGDQASKHTRHNVARHNKVGNAVVKRL